MVVNTKYIHYLFGVVYMIILLYISDKIVHQKSHIYLKAYYVF